MEARRRKSRSRGLRNRSGCLICRRRHLKCDEKTPTCGPCSKGNRICKYPSNETEPVESLSRDTQSGFLSGSAAPVWGNSEDFQLRESNSFSDNHELAQAAGGLLSLGDNFAAAEQLISITPIVETVETPPDAAFSRWLGLLTRNPSPDIGSPLTAAREFMCRPEPHSPSFDSSTLSRLLPSERIPVSSALLANSKPLNSLVDVRVIFDNFVIHTSSLIDLFDPLRHFSTLVPHLAVDHDGLKNAILALSARHLSLSKFSEQLDRNVGIQYYFDTLHYLQKAIQYETFTVTSELLATALVVSTYEMLDDFGRGWERHLEGVFWIQRSQLIHGESGGLHQAVWWAWLRQDVWAAFREKRKTFSFWSPSRGYAEMAPYDLACRAIWLFARAVDYCSTEETEAAGENIQSRMERANQISKWLDNWQHNLTVEFTPLPCGKKSSTDVFEPIWIHPPAFGVAVQFYHSARILLLLHRPSLGGVQSYLAQRKLVKLSSETIYGIAMNFTDEASSFASLQCLYVAGIPLQEESQRLAASDIIDICQRRTGWPTTSLSEELRVEWDKMEVL